MVVTTRLHPDAHQRDVGWQHPLNPSDELGQTRTVLGELERRAQPTPGEVTHHRHRRRLAHINRHRDQPLQPDPDRTRRQLLRADTMNVHHEAHLPVVSGEPGAPTPDPQQPLRVPSDTSGGETDGTATETYISVEDPGGMTPVQPVAPFGGLT